MHFSSLQFEFPRSVKGLLQIGVQTSGAAVGHEHVGHVGTFLWSFDPNL